MLGRLSGKTIQAVAIAASLAVLLAGCGGGKKHAATGTSPSSSVAAMGATPAETKAQIRRNWETFFDGSKSVSKRILLLQNGDQFSALVKTVNGSALAKQVKATVSRVTLEGPSKAIVTYTILLAGTPVLKNAKGTAVLVDGTWKVGVASFCKLVALQGSTPAACSAAAKQG
jgi:hypothetical protein